MSLCIYYPLRSRIKTNCHATPYFGFLATENTESSLNVKLSISSSLSFLVVKNVIRCEGRKRKSC